MITVRFPRVMAPAIGDATTLSLEADTVGSAIEAMTAAMPAVRVHLFDETGTLRPHVLCFVDGESNRLLDAAHPVASDITFVQSVSGG